LKKRGDEEESERLVAMADAYYHAVCFLAHQAEHCLTKAMLLNESIFKLKDLDGDGEGLNPAQRECFDLYKAVRSINANCRKLGYSDIVAALSREEQRDGKDNPEMP